MRTTLDLPDDLIRAAKILAVQRGFTLREFVASGLRREIAFVSSAGAGSVPMPLVHVASDAPILSMSPRDISAALHAEVDAEDHARAG